MTTAIIVDNDNESKAKLQTLFTENDLQIKVVGFANDVLSAVKEINVHQPDVVFLEIDLPSYNGFKLIEHFDEVSFNIIFTTAQEKYAINAFQYAPLGFLLKPIGSEELIDVVNRIDKKNRKNISSNNNNTFQKKSTKHRIKLPAKKGFLYLTVDEILCLHAEGRDTNICLTNGEIVMTNVSLKECEKIFFHTALIRIHKSHMVNLAYVKKYIKKLDSYLVLENDKRLDIGQAYKEQLVTALSFFGK